MYEFGQQQREKKRMSCQTASGRVVGSQNVKGPTNVQKTVGIRHLHKFAQRLFDYSVLKKRYVENCASIQKRPTNVRSTKIVEFAT